MNEITLRDAFGDYLVQLGKNFDDIVVLDCDLSSSTRTNKFAKVFPDRFFNLGIAEQNMLGTALGLAISGKIPIVSGFAIFTTGRAWEFIRMACHDNLNVKIITTHGGIVGGDGSTHHALEDLCLMSTLPNLNVLVPADNIELVEMLKFAIKTKGPFYIRLPRGIFTNWHDKDYSFLLGSPEVVKNGEDVCLIGTGYGSILALKLVKTIESQLKISIKVINLSTVKPINKEKLINEIKNVRGILVIEEHNIYCGIGSILARIISKFCPKPMEFIGIEDSFGQSGSRDALMDHYGYTIANIKKKVKVLLEIK